MLSVELISLHGSPTCAHGRCLPQLASSGKPCTFSDAIPSLVPHGVAQTHSICALPVQETLTNASVLVQAS